MSGSSRSNTLDRVRLAHFRRDLDRQREPEPAAATRRACDEVGLLDALEPGCRLAIAVGSRHIPGSLDVVRAIVERARARGLVPSLIAAMGSHGGATAEGQRDVLAKLGFDERELDVPIDTSMETVELGRTDSGDVVYTAAAAATGVDAIVVVNRIKRHTAFGGRLGSGLCKMLALGLGKELGAQTLHAAGIERGLGQVVEQAARVALRRLPVVGGIALIENAAGNLARVVGVIAAGMVEREAELLQESTPLRPSLDVDDLHVLILDRMGKDISGTGMDPWIIGRLMSTYEVEPTSPRIARVYVRSLTARSGGNAHGVGLADFVHRRVADAIDWRVTATNALTAGAPQRSRLPLVVATDGEGIAAAMASGGCRDPSALRMMRVRDTAHLGEVTVSAGLVAEVEAAGWERVSGSSALEFDSVGNLSGPP